MVVTVRILALSLILQAAAMVGCAGAPRTAPFRGGPIATGPQTIEAARKYLEGRWRLISYEILPPGRAPIQLRGTGTLTYDGFGNLEMQIRVEDPATSDALARAGIPLVNGVLSTTGRATIDMQARALRYIADGQLPLLTTAPAAPLAMSRPRYWEVDGNTLTLTTRGDDGKPLSVGRWQKQ